jgi:sulfur relay (sulfurtransferase) DsrF/TusC family protein
MNFVDRLIENDVNKLIKNDVNEMINDFNIANNFRLIELYDRAYDCSMMID